MDTKITRDKNKQEQKRLSTIEHWGKGLSILWDSTLDLLSNSGSSIAQTTRQSYHLLKVSDKKMSDNGYEMDANTDGEIYMEVKLPKYNHEAAAHFGIAQDNYRNLKEINTVLGATSKEVGISGLQNLNLPKNKSFLGTVGDMFGINGVISFVTGVAQTNTIEQISSSLRDKSADYIKRFVLFSSAIKGSVFGELQSFLALVGAMTTIFNNDDLNDKGDPTKAAAEYDLERNKGMTKLSFGLVTNISSRIASLFKR